MSILTINLVLTTFIYWIAARIYLLPRLETLGARRVLPPILLLHALRHLGLMFLSAGATYPGMPPQFAYPAALGDVLAALLALAALPAVLAGARWRPLVWVFNVWGTIDLLTAIGTATYFGAEPYMGAAYWIPAFWVPALLVTHYVTFVLLLSPAREQSDTRAGAGAGAGATAENGAPLQAIEGRLR